MTGLSVQKLRRCSSISQLTIDLLSKWFFNYHVTEMTGRILCEYVVKTGQFHNNSFEILLGFLFLQNSTTEYKLVSLKQVLLSMTFLLDLDTSARYTISNIT